MANSANKLPFEDRPSRLKIIYASFSKCRTKTMARALRSLGLKVHDYQEHQIIHHKNWLKILDNKTHPSIDERLEILYEMYKDADAVVAWPTYHYWKEFSIVFPKAKILLYERPIEKWMVSSDRQFKILASQPKIPSEIYMIFLKVFAPNFYYMQYYHNLMAKYDHFAQPFYGFYSLKDGRFDIDWFHQAKVYRAHNADVKLNAPSERLIILTKGGFFF